VGGAWGVPKRGKEVRGIEMSYADYLRERDAHAKEFGGSLKQIGKGLKEHELLTLRLIGNEDRPGYYTLRQQEALALKRLQEERVRLERPWATTLYNAARLRGRRQQLEDRVRELGGNPSLVKRSLK
jgi:hypothetical protein